MTKRRRHTWGGRRVAVLLLLASGASQQVLAQGSPDALFASASPSVVKLIIKDEDNREIGTGSGFVVGVEEKAAGDKARFESTIVTNYHVVYPAVGIEVRFPNRVTGTASQLLVEDLSADIAVLTVVSSTKPEGVLKLCEGDAPPIGARVFAIGSPLGFSNTLSDGLVSGYREREGGAPWMQISTPISPGSSGGPLLSTSGCVLGMTTATATDGQNLNFAVPTKEISRVLNGPKKPHAVKEHELDPRVMCRKLSAEEKDKLLRFAEHVEQAGGFSKLTGPQPERSTLDDRKRRMVACEAAVALEPRNTELLFNLHLSYSSVAYWDNLQWLRKSVQVLERMVELDPRSVDAFHGLCSDYGMLREHDSAILNCRMALLAEPFPVNQPYHLKYLNEAQERKRNDLRFRVPPQWIPVHTLYLASYRLPLAEGDAERHTVVWNFRLPDYPPTDGSFATFLATWAGRYKIDPQNVDVEVIELGPLKVRYFELATSHDVRENYLNLAAYVESAEQSWIIQVIGPPSTVAAARDDFHALLRSLRRWDSD